MKGFTVAEARARFGDLLDQAEQGDPVIIERRGVRFRLQAEAPAKRILSTRFFDWLDPAVEAGEWTWELASGGARFKARRSRKRR
jgi:prevent-host-death family protein